MMRFVMISDVHLEGLDDPNQAALVRWLDGVEADELVLLGDVFHYWWGFPGAVLVEYAPVCAALLRLRSRGVALRIVPGNHDFALGPFFSEQLGAVISGHHALSLDGVPYHLAHGDEADETWGYRGARLVLRGRPFAGLMRLLGPARGVDLLRRLAGTSRAYPAPRAALLDAQRRWAAVRIAEGARYVVLGHSHAPGIEELEGGSLINLGDWRAGPVWLEVVGGVPELKGVSR